MKEKLKHYEFKGNDLECFSVDEYVDVDNLARTGETLIEEEILDLLIFCITEISD